MSARIRTALPTAFDPLPEPKTPVPMTAMEFKRLSSMLVVIMGDPDKERSPSKVSRWMAGADAERRLAGQEPLAPFSPIARAALPRLRSLGR